MSDEKGGGWDLFLPFNKVKEVAEFINEADNSWDEFFNYLADSGFIRSWPCEDIDRNPLDPRKSEDYQKLDAPMVMRLVQLLANKASARDDSGE